MPSNVQLTVAICIPTFRRPEGLAKLLLSLDDLVFEHMSEPLVKIIVIDNDAGAPLASSHPHLLQARRWPISYQIESKPGVSNVRNAALSAVGNEFDFIAFVDDDEWVEPKWLEALLQKRLDSGAEVIQGPVVPVFDDAAPDWMRQGGYFEVGPFEDGALLSFGASGNCLIDVPSLARSGVRFNAEFNISGGEDTAFFTELLDSGWRLVAASEARAFENVPAERARLSYILRLRYRNGNTLGRLVMASGRWSAAAQRFAKALAWIGRGLGRMVKGVWQPDEVLHGRADLAFGAGMVSGLMRLKTWHYARPEDTAKPATPNRGTEG